MVPISDVLDTLRVYGIAPLDWPERDLPGIGEIEENETIYGTSIAEVFPQDEETSDGPGNIVDADDPRIREWWEQFQRIIDAPNEEFVHARERRIEIGRPAEP